MFRDFKLLHGAAEPIPLTDVTKSVFVVYGHFGLDTICLFSFLVFPCWGLLWWLPFLRLLSFIHYVSFTLVPHILAVFSFPLILQFPNLFRLVALLYFCTFLWCFPFLHLFSFPFAFTFTLQSPIFTSHIISLFYTLLLWSVPISKPGFMILLPLSPGSNFTLQQPDWLFYLPENQSPPTPSSVQ